MTNRRGITFIEVVLSLALLASVTATISAAITMMSSGGARDQRRLEAMEVAHRTVMQFIDDRGKFAKLRSESNIIQQGRHNYRYYVREEFLEREDIEDASTTSRRRAVTASDASLGEKLTTRLYQITIEVYAVDDHTGEIGASPAATLVRVDNPLTGDESQVLSWILDEHTRELDRMNEEGQNEDVEPGEGG